LEGKAMSVQHKKLAGGRWAKMSLAEQIKELFRVREALVDFFMV
jgi:hypothetical protein